MTPAQSLGTRGAAGPLQARTLTATVGPGFTITLRNADGARVTRLPTSTGELGYRVDAGNLLAVCGALRDTPELKFEQKLKGKKLAA